MNISTNYSTHFENELISDAIKKTSIYDAIKNPNQKVEIVFEEMVHKRVKEIKAKVLK